MIKWLETVHLQLTKATEWLERKIADEAAKRPEQVKRYQDTLALLRDRISDNDGNESIPLSKEDAETLCTLLTELNNNMMKEADENE